MSTQTNHMDSEDNIYLIANELCSIADLGLTLRPSAGLDLHTQSRSC